MFPVFLVLMQVLVFLPPVFGQESRGGLVYEWGGSYRRYDPPPEHDDYRREILDTEDGNIRTDDLRRLPAYGTDVRFFILEPEEYEDERWYCFTFGTSWNLVNPGRGGWVIKKKIHEENAIASIRMFITPNGSSYLDIYPGSSEGDSLFTIYLEGRQVQQDVPVGLGLDEIARSSFTRFAELSAAYVDWSFYFPAPESLASAPVRDLSSVIRTLLPKLNYADDGALDRDGNFIRISDGTIQEAEPGFNCSGFLKWIVDGLAYPITGELFSVELLKEKRTELRGNRWSSVLEDVRDPYFGLDWTRNLALAYRRIVLPEADVSQVDVSSMRYHQYRGNVGYPVSWLRSIAWELAVREPGYIYLLSVNEQRGDPPLREHFHTAVLFPYIDGEGNLRPVVFESNRETPVGEFISRYPLSYVHLVRLAAESRFDPPAVRLEPVLRRP